MPGLDHYVGPVGGLDWKSSQTTPQLLRQRINQALTNRDVQCCEMLLSNSISADSTIKCVYFINTDDSRQHHQIFWTSRAVTVRYLNLVLYAMIRRLLD